MSFNIRLGTAEDGDNRWEWQPRKVRGPSPRLRGICSGYFQLREVEIDELLMKVGTDARETVRTFDVESAIPLDYERICEEAERESGTLVRSS